MASSAAIAPVWVRRRALLDECRRAADGGQDIHLVGESGVGKTALARRIRDDAIYLAHPSPAGEVLAGVLWECYKRDWWTPDDDEEEIRDEEALGKAVRKLGQKPPSKPRRARWRRAKRARASSRCWYWMTSTPRPPPSCGS